MGLGKIYRAFRLGIERFRIGGFETAEAVEKQTIAVGIMRRRRGALVAFAVLAIVSGALDLQFAARLEDVQLPSYLEDRLHLPTVEGLRDFASALAVAVATVTAILLSISLVVLQNAGQRYGGRLVRYLLAERVTGYIIDVLFLAFLFSIWTVAFLLVAEDTPFFSLTVLSILVLVVVLSLSVYREYALSMLAPRGSVDVVTHEVIRMLRRVPLRGSRGSEAVADWLMRSVSARLADMESLVEPLLNVNNRDVESASHLVRQMQGLLGFYASMKQRIPADSRWFPRTYEPVAQGDRFSFVRQRSMFDQLGLGRPTEQVPDPNWFETRIFRVLDRLTDRCLKDATEVPAQLLGELSITIDHLMAVQSEFAFQEALSLGERITRSLPVGNETAAHAVNYGVAVGQMAAKGADWSTWCERGVSMLRGVPEERVIWDWGAPAATEGVLLKARSKLELEKTLMGSVVTPESWFRPELEEELREVHVGFQKPAFLSAIRCLSEIVGREGLQSKLGVAGTYGTLLLWHQCLRARREDLETLLPAGRVSWAVEGIIELQRPDAPGREWEGPLMDEVTSCAMLLLFEGSRFVESQRLIDPLVVRVLMPFASATEWLDAMHRLQAVAGLALLLSEARQDQSTVGAVFERIEHVLEDDPSRCSLFDERWDTALEPWLAFSYGLQESLTMKYHSYFMRAWEELKTIGEVPIPNGPLWATMLDHPSKFLRGHIMHGTVSPHDCATEFLKQLKARRGKGGKKRDRKRSPEGAPESSDSGGAA